MSKKQNNEIKNEGKWLIEESSYGQGCQFSPDKRFAIEKDGSISFIVDPSYQFDLKQDENISLRPSWLDDDRAWYIDANGNVQIRKDVK